MAFIIKQITAYNYNTNNTKIQGTIELIDDQTQTKMEVKLAAEDCARIFEIFADRLAATVQMAAASILLDVSVKMPEAIAAPGPAVDDEIPF